MIKLSKSTITFEDKKAVEGVLDREYLGMGQDVQEFEHKLEKMFNRPVVCVANGTAALHLACQAAGLGLGDEVLVQSLTYVASFQAISATGAKPIPCEANPNTVTIDCDDASKRLNENTKAIMPVHYSGGVGNLDEIYNFANDNNLRVIEDAAHAFGSSYKNKIIGSFGDISCFSFDGIKNLTSGEGGCIVTDDENILKIVRDARLLGVENDTEKRYSGERSWNFDVTIQGWRYHMSNIMAAIGIQQLERFNEIANKRQALAKYYDKRLSDEIRVKFINHNYTEVVPHIYPVMFKNEKQRDKTKNILMNNEIYTGIHYVPNHLLTSYKDHQDNLLPISEKIFSEVLSLPLHLDMSNEDIDFICDIVIESLK
jgi:dTDP-4-amino-4,6-dideoxygalactose transaminase